MKAILIRPRFDEPTQCTFDFAAQILQWCRQANFDIVELAEGEAIRSRVEEELARGVDLFIHYDHGNEDALIGQDEKAVIDLKNCHLLAKIETYTLACLSAKNLGVEVWRKEGKYWGYTEVVSFTTDSLPEFQEAFNCGFRYRFIEGDTYATSLKLAQDTFDQLALQLVAKGKTFAAISMRMNRDSMRYYNGGSPGPTGGCLLGLLKLIPRLFMTTTRIIKQKGLVTDLINSATSSFPMLGYFRATGLKAS